MTVDGRNISGAPTLMPLIICSSLPSWLEWKTLTSTFPFSAVLALFAYSSVVMAKSEPGNPTWPSLTVVGCWARAGEWNINRLTKITARSKLILGFTVCSPFLPPVAESTLQIASPLDDALGPSDVKYTADAEAGHVAGCLLRRPAIFLDPLQHFPGKIGGEHPMAAHRAQLQRGRVWELLQPSPEAHRIFHAMTADPGLSAAALGLVDGRADVDRDAQVSSPQLLDKILHRLVVVEDGRDRSVSVDAGDHLFRVQVVIPFPMGDWIHVLPRPDHSTLGGVTYVHRFVLKGESEKGAILFHQVIIVDPPARHGEDDVVILDRLGVRHRLEGVVLAVAMEGIRHLSCAR